MLRGYSKARVANDFRTLALTPPNTSTMTAIAPQRHMAWRNSSWKRAKCARMEEKT